MSLRKVTPDSKKFYKQWDNYVPAKTYGAFFKDTTGGSQTYTSDRRNSPRVRQHAIAWSPQEAKDLISRGYTTKNMAGSNINIPKGQSAFSETGKLGYSPPFLKQEAKRGFHSSNLKLTKYNIPNAVSKRGGILGKSLGVIAMVGVNMLKKSAMGINKGARMLVDYTATKGVLGAGRLGLQRGSKTLKTPSGLVQALSRTRHGRG